MLSALPFHTKPHNQSSQSEQLCQVALAHHTAACAVEHLGCPVVQPPASHVLEWPHGLTAEPQRPNSRAPSNAHAANTPDSVALEQSESPYSLNNTKPHI